jgi:aminoglycoside phosphotransferase (APT) family kinase protein
MTANSLEVENPDDQVGLVSSNSSASELTNRGEFSATTGPQGFDVKVVMPWLEAKCEWMKGPYSWERLAGGHSNLTYRVADSLGNTFVLRRPPEGDLLPSAHDMAREFKIMTALWPTPVPVAEPLAFCDDKSLTGAVFYAMRAIEGKSLYALEEVEALIPEALRREHGFHFIDVLADLHAIDPNAVGLGDLGRPDAYVARQLKRWRASWDASKTVTAPDVELLHEFLLKNTPEQGPARLVHGDYGLHNCVSNGAGRVAAVIDWEISTLGDALADLAYAINGWGKQGEVSARGIRPSQAPGYPSDDELLARYAAKTGVDLSNIGFYISFNHWKTVCILNGVLARYYAGQKSTEGVDIDGLCGARDEALAKAIAAAEPLGYARSSEGNAS